MVPIPSWQLIRSYYARASKKHEIQINDVALELGVSTDEASSWCVSNSQYERLPVHLVASFAKATRLSRAEMLDLMLTRLGERNHPQSQMEDLNTLLELIMPDPDEQAVIDILREEKAKIGWHSPLFNNLTNQDIMRDSINLVVSNQVFSDALRSKRNVRGNGRG